MNAAPTALVEAGLVFVLVSVVYIASPTWNAVDSSFVLPTAMSIIRHGNANIDEYRGRFGESPWAVYHERGHDWNLYPIGTPLMVLPIVWVWDRVVASEGRDLEAIMLHSRPVFAEETLASLITALAATLLFWHCRKRLTLPRAIILTALFAFGTSAYSTASRGLWQHGPAMLVIMLAIVLYDRLEAGRWTTVLLGIVAGYSWAVRPSNLLFLIGLAVLLAIEHRSRLVGYVCGSILGAAPKFWYNLSAFGTWTNNYDRQLVSASSQTHFHWEPIFGTLISPSRGLFVFCPFILWLALRATKHFRRRHPPSKLELMLVTLCAVWWLGVTRMPNWWGGGSFGPRLLSEVMLCSVILLIPVVQELSLQDGWVLQLIATGFVLTGALSVAIHLRGAVAQPATMWLQYPVNLDDAPYRLWNWHDPQFLRGMGYSTGREQNNPYTLGAVLDFRKGGNALNFEGERWDSPEPGGSRTVGGHSVLVLQLAAAPTSDLVLSIEANVLPRHNAAAFGLSTDTRKIGLSLHTLRINAAPR